MKFYAKIFLIAGVILPVSLHLLARQSTPWWPDTVSLGIGFGFAAVLIAHKAPKDHEINRRLWKALKDLASRWSHSN
jgi:hypothetical protein